MNIEVLYLILSGLVGGFLAGLLGIGGGVIYILILPIALSSAGVCDESIVPYTIANSVFAILMASLSGNVFNYFRKRLFIFETMIIGVPASIISILCMKFIVSEPWYSKEIFNVIVILLLLFMLVKMTMERKTVAEEKTLAGKVLVLIGVGAGMVSSLTGLGGGIIIVPMLQAFFKLPVKKAKDISLGVIGVLALALSGYNLMQQPNCYSNEYQQGLIVFPTVLIMIAGVMVGSPAGVWLSNKLQPKHIKLLFLVLLVSVITRKLIEFI